MSGTSWLQVVRHRDGIGWVQEPAVKSFLIEGERHLAILDTGMGVGDFAGTLASFSEREPLVLQTHAHWDHIGSSQRYERVLVHPAEADGLRAGCPNAQLAPTLRRFTGTVPLPAGSDLATAAIPPCEPSGILREGDRIDLGGRSLEVYETPGHSPGSLSFLEREARALFTGDAVGLRPMLLCLPGSDPAAFRRTIARLAALAEEADEVFVCHGDPLLPDDVREIRDAYEEVWSGRPVDVRDTLDLGWLSCRFDGYDFGRFQFLLTPGSVT